MSVSPAYKIFLEDLFAGFGRIGVRNMFGGGGVYHDGMMIGLVAGETLYLKVDDETRSDFEAAGSRPFTYTGKSKPVTMSYWEVPDALYDDPQAFAEWARKAYEAARRARK